MVVYVVKKINFVPAIRCGRLGRADSVVAQDFPLTAWPVRDSGSEWYSKPVEDSMKINIITVEQYCCSLPLAEARKRRKERFRLDSLQWGDTARVGG